jgi:hypothetical protein
MTDVPCRTTCAVTPPSARAWGMRSSVRHLSGPAVVSCTVRVHGPGQPAWSYTTRTTVPANGSRASTGRWAPAARCGRHHRSGTGPGRTGSPPWRRRTGSDRRRHRSTADRPALILNDAGRDRQCRPGAPAVPGGSNPRAQPADTGRSGQRPPALVAHPGQVHQKRARQRRASRGTRRPGHRGRRSEPGPEDDRLTRDRIARQRRMTTVQLAIKTATGRAGPAADCAAR